MEDILAQRISARVTHIKYGLSQIFCMEIVKDKGHVVGIREILKNEDIRNIYFLYIHFFVFRFFGLRISSYLKTQSQCIPIVYPIRKLKHIRIHHDCEGWIEKPVTRITFWHHEAYRTMTTGDPEGQNFAIPSSHE